jgi:short-subunit dehydrogenase
MNLFSSGGRPRLDYLFNNAGVSTRAKADGFASKNLETVIRLNLVTPCLLSKFCLPTLREFGGAIVNTSSIASWINSPLRSAYSVSYC